MLYSLEIKNAFGELEKKYYQTVFAYLTAHDLSDFLIEPFFESTMKSAMTSLTNQFLNDDNTVTKIKESLMGVKTQNDYAQIDKIKIKYCALLLKEEELKSRCLTVNGNFQELSTEIAANNEMVKNNKLIYNNHLNTQANDISQSVNSLGSSLIVGIMEGKEMKRDNNKIENIKKDLAAFYIEKGRLLDKISQLPLTPEANDLISSLSNNDANMSAALTDLMKSRNAAQEKLNVTKTNTSSYLSNLSNAMYSLKAGNAQAASAAITADDGTGTPSCMQQATATWKSSNEYKTYMRTKLNADASDCKAKMIELTVQYCSSSLSAQEIADYNRIAKETRQEATTLRNAMH